jgi:hypothetical protein
VYDPALWLGISGGTPWANCSAIFLPLLMLAQRALLLWLHWFAAVCVLSRSFCSADSPQKEFGFLVFLVLAGSFGAAAWISYQDWHDSTATLGAMRTERAASRISVGPGGNGDTVIPVRFQQRNAQLIEGTVSITLKESGGIKSQHDPVSMMDCSTVKYPDGRDYRVAPGMLEVTVHADNDSGGDSGQCDYEITFDVREPAGDEVETQKP